MKKLVISLLVVVMALGTMGVAFTNGFNVPKTGGYAAEGFAYLEHIHCVHVAIIPYLDEGGLYWGVYGSGKTPPQEALQIQGVCLKFDKPLVPFTQIFAGITDDDGGGYPDTYLAFGYSEVPAGGCPAGDTICVYFQEWERDYGGDGYIWGDPVHISYGPDIIDMNRVVVRVIGGEAAMQHGPMPH